MFQDFVSRTANTFGTFTLGMFRATSSSTMPSTVIHAHQGSSVKEADIRDCPPHNMDWTSSLPNPLATLFTTSVTKLNPCAAGQQHVVAANMLTRAPSPAEPFPKICTPRSSHVKENCEERKGGAKKKKEGSTRPRVHARLVTTDYDEQKQVLFSLKKKKRRNRIASNFRKATPFHH